MRTDPDPVILGGTSSGRNGEAAPIPGRLLLLFALACGLSVATIYVAQPLLGEIARDLGIAPAAVGGVVAVTQLGYGLGLAFLVPLGDLLERRRLVTAQMLLCAAAVLVAGLAPNRLVLLGALFCVGLLAVVVQTLVALTASLAPDAQRGRAVGLVTSGVVIGILLARFIAGVIADLGGWRMVYLCMAPAILVVSALLRASLPRQQVAAHLPYAALLRSLPALLRDEPLLRLRAALAFLAFAAVNVLWAPLSLPLAAPPLLLSPSQIGLFGLAGLAGALAAGKAGMLADRGLGQWTTLVALVALTVSWGLVALLPVSLTALAIGVIILDFAIQAVHVTNQALIFTLRPEARSRLVAAYMLFYSAGSALGAAASTAAYASAGWTGVCLLGGAISVAALLLWAVAAFRPRSPCLQRESPCGG